jgi:hypothetical protein
MYSYDARRKINFSLQAEMHAIKTRAAKNLGKNVKLSVYLTNYALRHEGVWGSRCIDPYFFDLGTSWRGVVSFTPQPL